MITNPASQFLFDGLLEFGQPFYISHFVYPELNREDYIISYMPYISDFTVAIWKVKPKSNITKP